MNSDDRYLCEFCNVECSDRYGAQCIQCETCFEICLQCCEKCLEGNDDNSKHDCPICSYKTKKK